MRDLTIAHADVTYLADYETPSGGGYSVHRGGAVEIEGAENPGKKENTPFLYNNDHSTKTGSGQTY